MGSAWPLKRAEGEAPTRRRRTPPDPATTASTSSPFSAPRGFTVTTSRASSSGIKTSACSTRLVLATRLQWEHASSPLIYKNLVIVQADIQNAFIAAYDLKSASRSEDAARRRYRPGTPTVYEGKARAELITNGRGRARLRPATGKQFWGCRRTRRSRRRPFRRARPDLCHRRLRPIQPIYAIRPGATATSR